MDCPANGLLTMMTGRGGCLGRSTNSSSTQYSYEERLQRVKDLELQRAQLIERLDSYRVRSLLPALQSLPERAVQRIDLAIRVIVDPDAFRGQAAATEPESNPPRQRSLPPEVAAERVVQRGNA